MRHHQLLFLLLGLVAGSKANCADSTIGGLPVYCTGCTPLPLNDDDNPAGMLSFKGLVPAGMNREEAELSEAEKLKEIKERIAQAERSLMALPVSSAGLDRHANTATNMFSAYSTATMCGVGTLTSWTENVDIGIGSSTTVGTFAGGIHSTTTAAYYLYYASFRCAQGSACDVTCRKTGNRVCAIGSRNNIQNGGQRWQQSSNAIIENMAATDTMSLYEEAGGGTPNNCKYSNIWRYSQFLGLLIITP